jgi:RNA polymerase sigma-70 factor (ECF subfamily)
LEDDELIERAKQGDGSAYGELVRRYQAVAFRAAYAVTKDMGEAEDVVQEAFVKAYRALGGFRCGAPFRPWLLRIATNEALKHQRSSRRRIRSELGLAEDPSLREEVDPSPEEKLLASERQRALLKAVQDLREEDRLVIACRCFLDLSEKETAEVLDCPRGTVKSRFSRAIRRLRERLPNATSERAEGERYGRGGPRSGRQA